MWSFQHCCWTRAPFLHQFSEKFESRQFKRKFWNIIIYSRNVSNPHAHEMKTHLSKHAGRRQQKNWSFNSIRTKFFQVNTHFSTRHKLFKSIVFQRIVQNVEKFKVWKLRNSITHSWVDSLFCRTLTLKLSKNKNLKRFAFKFEIVRKRFFN